MWRQPNYFQGDHNYAFCWSIVTKLELSLFQWVIVATLKIYRFSLLLFQRSIVQLLIDLCEPAWQKRYQLQSPQFTFPASGRSADLYGEKSQDFRYFGDWMRMKPKNLWKKRFCTTHKYNCSMLKSFASGCCSIVCHKAALHMPFKLPSLHRYSEWFRKTGIRVHPYVHCRAALDFSKVCDVTHSDNQIWLHCCNKNLARFVVEMA